jgi:hypothetical protein
MVRDQHLFRPPRDMTTFVPCHGPSPFLGEAMVEYMENRNFRLHTLPTRMMQVILRRKDASGRHKLSKYGFQALLGCIWLFQPTATS